MAKLDIGQLGFALPIGPADAHLTTAAELTGLGYSAIWLAGGQIDRLDRITAILDATSGVRVGSAIIAPDVYDADEVCAWYAATEATTPGRSVVGLGGPQRARSLAALGSYLDRLDSPLGVPVDRRLLAALGPKKLQLARDRCAGAITLLVTPESTAAARRLLGRDGVLVTELPVVLDTQPDAARSAARGMLDFLARVPGYRSHFRRMGFGAQDIADLSGRLVDALVPWGDAETIARRVAEQLAAGADHVILAPILAPGDSASAVARLLAEPLLSA